MPADLTVLLSFARSAELSSMVQFALEAGTPSLDTQADASSQPFIERLESDHFDFLDRINAALARESAHHAAA